jgi:hypothetical protein
MWLEVTRRLTASIVLLENTAECHSMQTAMSRASEKHSTMEP